MKDDPATDGEDPSKTGLLLNAHRKTVQTSTGMSSAVLLGSSFAMAMALFAWLGNEWDNSHGTAPWGVLTGVTAGLLYGAYEVWKVIQVPSDKQGEPSSSISDEHSP